MSMLILCGLVWTNQARSRELVQDFDAIGHYPVVDPEECGSADEVAREAQSTSICLCRANHPWYAMPDPVLFSQTEILSTLGARVFLRAEGAECIFVGEEIWRVHPFKRHNRDVRPRR